MSKKKKAPPADPPAAPKPLTVNQLIRKLFALDPTERGSMPVVIVGEGGVEFALSAREGLGDCGDGEQRVFFICGEAG